jgi:hypothetical protein
VKNLIKQIFENSGRKFEYDNRNFATKSLNMLLKRGEINIHIKPIGICGLRDKNKPKFEKIGGLLNLFNLKIEAYGYNCKYYLKDEIEPEFILNKVGVLFKDSKIQENRTKSLKINFELINDCQKCEGKGFITGFSHYCQGICFDCGGSGFGYKHNLEL